MTEQFDNDDDLLEAYDLSAWDVPPPAPGLVDAVIARARQPAAVAAVDTGEPLGARGKRRWLVAATAAAVAVVAILIGVWGVQRSPKDGQGEVTATSARTLAIGPTTAALDPGAQVRWRRHERRISVAQVRGTAMWNVATEDTLVIDAGAMVATVEASGASLRVEVEMMNASDARAIGISAATAVAVALVTIVVYEGTVRVRHDGQTVNVVPGAHYEVRPANAPEPIAVGGGPSDQRIRELEDKIKQMEADRDALKKTVPDTFDFSAKPDTCDEVSCVLTNYAGACCARFKAQTPPKHKVPDNGRCDEVSCVLNNYDGACCAKFKAHEMAAPPSTLDSLDRAAISDTMQRLKPGILACATAEFVGTLKAKVTVAPDGHVTSVVLSGRPEVPDVLAACVRKVVEAGKFSSTTNGGAFSYPFVFSGSMDAPCDADALTQKGDDHLQTGMDAAALHMYEQSMKCRPAPTLHKKAFLAACRSKNAPKAQVYYSRMSLADRSKLAPICVRLGIQLEEPTAAAANAGGVIKIASTPPAKILLDGVDTGKTTPMAVQAAPGNHKITFIVGNDKYTYAVSTRAGETVTLTKDLR